MIKNSNNKMLYWSEKQCRYGKVTVELVKDVKSEIPFVSIKKFNLTMQGGAPKKVTVFHISNWREHEIPHSDLYFSRLYKEVSQHAGSRKVLIHSSHGSGSRVFMYTYFCCIFEAMEADATIDNSLEVVKQVRTRRYGGSISSMEYAYIVKSLVTFFFEHKMLVDVTKHQLDFCKEYEDFNYYSVIDRTSRLVHSFKVFHYTIWPDKGIPTESHSLHGLYKRIIELYDNSHIAIHCSNGIGRTGTLAFIIHMIDVIKSKAPFDPIKCLATVRTYRCKVVQTKPQFVFALTVVYKHFKDKIEEMDKKAYGKFMTVSGKFLDM
uniref:Protein tyrosine phosphatase n=1 Tax=Strongyloides stercoralis TaxID=6248 RepID=A0A0K0E068_STRER